MITAELTIVGLARRMEQVTTQESDAVEEICRFARPLLAPAAGRRL